jgi:DNA repair protein RadC
MIPLTNSAQCERFLREIWERGTMKIHERVYAVFLNDKGHREWHKCICKGCYCSTDFDLREVVHYAIVNHFDYVMLAHNHPSGDCRPSKQDIEFTKHIYHALCALDITMVDNFIITYDNIFSYKDAGIIASYHKDCTTLRNAG